MVVSAEVNLGSRTVMEYLLSPIEKEPLRSCAGDVMLYLVDRIVNALHYAILQA